MASMIPSLLHNLGHLARRGGDVSRAGQLFRDGIALFRGQEDARGVAECLGGLALADAATGHLEIAARLLGAAEALLVATGSAMWPPNRADYNRIRDDVRSRLGDLDFETAWSAGQAMSSEQAMDYALTSETAT